MSYLLGITIGPVQTYIEESRKLSDLRNSSRIISDIMKKICEYLKDKSKNVEMIYPNHENLENKVDYSNYMIIEIEDIIDMKDIQKKMYGKYEKEFKESFYLFWGIQVIDEEGYSVAYENLVQLVDSIKNTYEFEELNNELSEQGNKKCSICGKRNSVNLGNCKRKKFKLIEGEDLCEICLVKRTYEESNNYDSVYTTAIKEWGKLHENELNLISTYLGEIFKNKSKYYNKDEINKLIRALDQILLDLNQAFEEKIETYNRFSINNIMKLLNDNKMEITLKKLKEITQDINDADESSTGSVLLDKLSLNQLSKKLKTLKESMEIIYKNEEIKNPNYEYCFIQVDIDNLGRWMNGKYLEDKKKLKEEQKNISNILVRFGQELRKELSTTNCDIIYSGGDDFLGVLPNEEIINVVKTIESVFEREVKSKIRENINNDITYSTSITIAQCKDPMNYAIRKSRLELENVKNRFEEDKISKNGVALTYIINNGKEITCYLKKEQLNTMIGLVKNLKTIESEMSFAYINNFEREFLKFNYKDITLQDLQYFYTIVKYELKRLMDRSKVSKYENKKTKEISTYINEFLEFTIESIDRNYKKLKPNSYDVDFKNIMNIIKIYEKLSKINFNGKGDMQKSEIN